MTNKNPNKTEEYILKPGHSHMGFKDGDRHTYTGDDGNNRVQLNAEQFEAFKDKFESVKDREDRIKAQQDYQNLQDKQDKIQAALEKKGLSLDDLLGDAELTIKKPDPSPSTGTAEPTPDNTTPAPVGSTSDPVNAKPAAGSNVPAAGAAPVKK